MDSGNENDNILSPEMVETPEVTSPNLLPEKSKKSYEIIYNQFMEWREKKQSNSFSERVLLAYFVDLSSKYKSSTLWTYYSMLRSTLTLHHNIKIEEYQKLRSFLKRKGEQYQPKKAKTLRPEEINKFITEAPDVKYLATKVALIMGIMGACRAHELYAMQMEDIQDLNTAFFVTVPNTRSKLTRRFTITDNFYNICKTYVDLRPPHAPYSSFFLTYQNGKCGIQKTGINKFGGMAKEVATYLKLPNPKLYTGHCFRRSSANLLVDGGGDIADLKRHGGWRTTSEGHIDESVNNILQTARKILPKVNSSAPCMSTSNESVPVPENGANLINKVSFDLWNGTPLEILTHNDDYQTVVSQADNTVEKFLDEELKPLSSAPSSSSNIPPAPPAKKQRVVGTTTKEDELLTLACEYLRQSKTPEPSCPTIAKVWGEKIIALDPQQRIFAEKAISDVLFEASLGNLDRHSVKINEDYPRGYHQY